MTAEALRPEDLPHYIYDDYVQWEGKWEIIYGIPYAMAPSPVIKHQWLVGKIIHYLKERLEECPKCEILMSIDWQITEDTVVQPDVVVVCDENFDIDGVKLETTPVLVFEILSPSTARKDKILKYQLYENAGVKYYCILDPVENSAEVFVLRKDKYTGADSLQEGLMMFDLEPCEIAFDFRQIFDI